MIFRENGNDGLEIVFEKTDNREQRHFAHAIFEVAKATLQLKNAQRK